MKIEKYNPYTLAKAIFHTASSMLNLIVHDLLNGSLFEWIDYAYLYYY
jgi:hypothetical protein